MADSTKFLLNTKISDKRVLELFAPKTVGGISPFTAANRRMIDTIVTGGIIKGASTKEIARAIKEELPKRMRSQSLALARTAIQDYNRQVKEAVWDANEESFVGLKYEWVAALDSRTCPTCAPLDGDVRDKRTDFPKTPVHVNCRCQVVLIDPDDEGEVRYGQQAYDQQPTGEGVYRTKKKVKGENLFRKNVEVKTVDGKSPRYADFLANSNRTTQAMFFGGGNPGAVRAERFRRMIKNGRSPQDALKDLTNRVPKTRADRRFKPVTD
jgi:SPP1 gp7 family putative phage head morphogenesis protein